MSASSDSAVTDGNPTRTPASTRPYTPATSDKPAWADPEFDALGSVLALDSAAQLRVAEFVASRLGKRVANKRAGAGE